MKKLTPHSQIKDYYINTTILEGSDYNVYKAEDFNLDKEVILTEYELFKKDIYECLLGLKHESINSIEKIFEYDKKVYTVSKLLTSQKLDNYLLEHSFSELEINRILHSLLDMVLLLKKRGLTIKVKSENFIVTQSKNIVLDNTINILKYEADEQLIYELGALIYFIITKKTYEDAFKLKANQKYSKALCGVVNRMLSKDSQLKFKNIEELNPLVKQNKSLSEINCEPIVCHEKTNKVVSKVLSTFALLLIISATLYVLISDKKVLNANEIGLLQSVQFHIAGYMGKSEAQYALANMYENGYFVDKDIKTSISWYEKAAKSDNLEAQLQLAYLYQYANGVDKDIYKAIYWYEKAARHNSEKAFYNLGFLYIDSDSQVLDYSKAFHYFSKIVDNNSNAQVAVGYMYENGYGVEKDYKKAVVLYKKAAKAGHEIAQLNLANAYHFGRGVKLNKKKAQFWYEKAIAQGNKVALERLKLLHQKPRVKQQKRQKIKKIDKQKKLYRVQQDKEQKNVYVEPESVSYGRLIDRGEFIEDTKTGLYWQKDGRSSGRLNFYQAKKYAKELYLGGVTGWRVPTAKELKTIFPAVDLPFINTPYTDVKCCEGDYEWHSYWTSELDTRMQDYAYIYQWYGDGGKNNCYASKNYDYVRCVHD